MIDIEGMRETVARGLKAYLGCPVVRANQNAAPPAYPYLSYTVTTPASENRGTYGEYDDGKTAKDFTATMSVTALSDKDIESVTLAVKAREWLDYAGSVYLDDNGVIVESVGALTNRDNILTVNFEYRNGFDVVFSVTSVLENSSKDAGYIETVEYEQTGQISRPDVDSDALNKALEERLSGVL